MGELKEIRSHLKAKRFKNTVIELQSQWFRFEFQRFSVNIDLITDIPQFSNPSTRPVGAKVMGEFVPTLTTALSHLKPKLKGRGSYAMF